MKANESTPPFDLVVSLDRADKTVAVAVFDPAREGFLAEREVPSAPAVLDGWWQQVRETHPKARIAVAFAQPAPNRVVVFAARHPEVIYALNPAATGSYRNALTVSHARNDQSDARDQARFVAHAWTQWWDARRAVIKNLVPLGAINPADELEVSIILHQLEVLNAGIKAHDSALAQFVKSAGEKAERIAALPGTDPIYTPRIHAAMEKHAPNCESPEAVAAALGIAPITDQSGKMGKVQRRRRDDTFTRQSYRSVGESIVAALHLGGGVLSPARGQGPWV